MRLWILPKSKVLFLKIMWGRMTLLRNFPRKKEKKKITSIKKKDTKMCFWKSCKEFCSTYCEYKIQIVKFLIIFFIQATQFSVSSRATLLNRFSNIGPRDKQQLKWFPLFSLLISIKRQLTSFSLAAKQVGRW